MLAMTVAFYKGMLYLKPYFIILIIL